MPESTLTLPLGNAERLGEQFDHRAVGFAAFGDGANPDFHHGAAIGQRLKPVDLVATAARGHPQRNADALGRVPPSVHPYDQNTLG